MKTILYASHCALSAKIVDFCGWEMPLQYQGIVHEHQVVRRAVGIFDVSHMGRILIRGQHAEKFLDYLSTNQISGKNDRVATYTVWCRENGGSVDDVIVYKEDLNSFFVVVNACNRDKDLLHVKEQSIAFDVEVEERYGEDGILSIQGPKADHLVGELFPEANGLAKMHFIPVTYNGNRLFLSRTGYTGSDGFEIYSSNSCILSLWESFLEKGKRYGIEPIGLGARDTLRLEMGYALYGHELNETIAPTESVSRWTVKWNKDTFLGKEALVKIENLSTKRHEVGIVMLDKAIPRENYVVYRRGIRIGHVTSGSYSPTLERPIAIILVQGELKEGDLVEVEIRKQVCQGKVVKLPF